jgi:hypothetical protein
LQTARETGARKIKGETVEAILGGVFSHFGSPAAHRTFHLHILPHFAHRFRDPMIVEKAEEIRANAAADFGGSIVPA